MHRRALTGLVLGVVGCATTQTPRLTRENIAPQQASAAAAAPEATVVSPVRTVENPFARRFRTVRITSDDLPPETDPSVIPSPSASAEWMEQHSAHTASSTGNETNTAETTAPGEHAPARVAPVTPAPVERTTATTEPVAAPAPARRPVPVFSADSSVTVSPMQEGIVREGDRTVLRVVGTARPAFATPVPTNVPVQLGVMGAVPAVPAQRMWVPPPTILRASLNTSTGYGTGFTSTRTNSFGTTWTTVREPREFTTQTGLATWQAEVFSGRCTASGSSYNPSGYTAAHRTLPFGTRVRVARTDGSGAVLVTITDRGPWGDHRRVIDVSRAAAQALGLMHRGLAEVRIDVLSLGRNRSTPCAERTQTATTTPLATPTGPLATPTGPAPTANVEAANAATTQL